MKPITHTKPNYTKEEKRILREKIYKFIRYFKIPYNIFTSRMEMSESAFKLKLLSGGHYETYDFKDSEFDELISILKLFIEKVNEFDSFLKPIEIVS